MGFEQIGLTKDGFDKNDTHTRTRADGKQVIMTREGQKSVDGSKDPNDPNYLLYLALKNMGLSGAQPLYAYANIAASTTDGTFTTEEGQTLIAEPGRRIVVINYSLLAGDTPTNLTFNSKGTGAGTAISMTHQAAPNGGLAPAYSPVGHFRTKKGETLTATTGAGATVGIQITYILI